MNVIDPLWLVRDLKGAPWAVLSILMLTRQAMTNRGLEIATGYGDKPIATAVAVLEQRQLIVRSNRGWRLMEGVQLALPMEAEPTPNPSLKGGEEIGEDVSESENFRVVNDDDDIEINLSDSSSLSSSLGGEKSEKIRVKENLRVFGELGIDVNRRTRALAGRAWVDAAYIRAHVGGLRAGQGMGLAILRMEQQAEGPKNAGARRERPKTAADWLGEDVEVEDE